ncbi:MAG TPA: hypothetical protein VGO52_19975 [Hyphomonadaceae bacterium]|nr:hypothetical protein [Hyphomonadaceae bacterium]
MSRPVLTRLQKKLPPLRFPSPPQQPEIIPDVVVRISEEQVLAARLERRRFQRRLDARMGALAFEMRCTPEECVGLALWFGDQGWSAFVVEFPYSEGGPTREVFARNLQIGAAAYDEKGDHRGDNEKRLAARAKPLLEQANQRPYTEGTVRSYVRVRRALHQPRNAELLAMYDGKESEMPLELVEERRRELVKHELRLSAARLTSAWERSGQTPTRPNPPRDSGSTGQCE